MYAPTPPVSLTPGLSAEAGLVAPLRSSYGSRFTGLISLGLSAYAGAALSRAGGVLPPRRPCGGIPRRLLKESGSARAVKTPCGMLAMESGQVGMFDAAQ